MFLTTLQVAYVQGDIWKLTAPLIYRSKFLDCDITVPTGYETDYASIPTWMPVANFLFKQEGQPAAVVHDYLITSAECDRADADEVFLEALKELPEVPRWKAYVMHWAVSFYRVIGRKK